MVLLLVQTGAGLLAAVGELLLMASPLYAVLPLLRAAAMVVLAVKVVRGRRWAIVAVIAVQWLGLLGQWVGVVLGALRELDPSFTLAGLLTGVALPVAVIILGARLLATRPAVADPATTPLPVLVAG